MTNLKNYGCRHNIVTFIKSRKLRYVARMYNYRISKNVLHGQIQAVKVLTKKTVAGGPEKVECKKLERICGG